jgi:hypothetical protein
MLVPALEAFDYSNTTSPLGERPVTTVAPQALLLLNDEFMNGQAAALAQRLRHEAGVAPAKQVRRGYELAFSRGPGKAELGTALSFLKRQARDAKAIQSGLTFRPDVPNSLSVEYLKQLKPDDYLAGPREGWSYHRGTWSAAYEGIRTVERPRGPFALWMGDPFSNGVVEASLVLDRNADFSSLLLRAAAEGDEQRGYEIVFDPRQQRVILRRHRRELATLAETSCVLPTGQPVPVKIEAAGAQLRVWLDRAAEPALDVTDPDPMLGSGRLGIRTWGAALSLDGLAVSTGGKKLQISPVSSPSNASSATKSTADARVTAEQKALEGFCLLLFNLNEFVYVD